MRLFITLTFSSIFFWACERAPKYPDTPIIDFKDIAHKTIYNDDGSPAVDSIYTTIYFKDGTGDLGLLESENYGTYLIATDSIKVNDTTYSYKFNRYNRNYWVDTYIKRDGQFVILKTTEEYLLGSQDLDFFNNDGRFKPFNNDYKTNTHPIEGSITHKFLIQSFLPDALTLRPIPQPNDTVKFDIRILDRKLNISNTVTTPEIVILKTN